MVLGLISITANYQARHSTLEARMPVADPANWFSLAMKEYDFLQPAIDKIDGQRFQIRNWSIIASGALFTASLSAKIPLIAFAGTVTTLFFCFLEVIYMQMVTGVIQRSRYLETLIAAYRTNGEEPSHYTFGVGQAFAGYFTFRQIPEMIFSRARIHVSAFYMGLLLVTIAGGIAVALR